MLFYGRNFNKLMEEGKEITNRRFITSERPDSSISSEMQTGKKEF